MNPFTDIFVKRPAWSKKPMPHEWKSSTDFGELRCFMNLQANPGESIKVDSEVQLKFAPMLAPVMHRINLITNYFFVPWRLIWKDYDKFLSGGVMGNEDLPNLFLTPKNVYDICLEIFNYINPSGSFPDLRAKALFGFKHSIFDTLGLPFTVAIHGANDNKTHLTCVLDCLAYNKVYCEYYADETQDRLYIEDVNYVIDHSERICTGFAGNFYDYIYGLSHDQEVSDTEFFYRFFILKTRCWEHDYFTSALPFSQRGPQVKVPLAGTVDVEIPDQEIKIDFSRVPYFNNPGYTLSTQGLPAGATHWQIVDGSPYIYTSGLNSNSGRFRVRVQAFDDNQQPVGSPTYLELESLFQNDNEALQEITAYLSSSLSGTGDLSNASAVTINTFRWLERLQAFLEKNARAGVRYIEQIAVHFGVKGDDLRLSRPKFLGGSTQPVQIGEVLQLSRTEDNAPLGDYGGVAGAYGKMNKFKYRCKEHGIFLAFACVMPRTNYYQGIPKHFLKPDRFDFLWPEFAHLGEQEIKNMELYYSGTSEDNGTFGYAPRYAEYMYIPSTVHGDFVDNLAYWHLARQFSSTPRLNSSFLHIDPTKFHRIFTIENDPNGATPMWFQIYNRVRMVRPLPKRPIPSL